MGLAYSVFKSMNPTRPGDMAWPFILGVCTLYLLPMGIPLMYVDHMAL